MHEICCAIDGIADEGWGGSELCFAFDEGFFADEGVGWVGGCETGGDHGFDCFIGFGYEIGSWGKGVRAKWNERGNGKGTGCLTYYSFWFQSLSMKGLRT